jgi:hypothetical protein
MGNGPWISPEVGAQGASVIYVESNKWTVIMAAICGVSMGVSAYLFAEYRDAKMETRMLEYYLLELDAKFIGAGLKDPADSIAGKLKKRQQEVEK